MDRFEEGGLQIRSTTVATKQLGDWGRGVLSHRTSMVVSVPIFRRIFFQQTFEVSSGNVYAFRRGKVVLDIWKLSGWEESSLCGFFLTIKFECTYFGWKEKFIDRNEDY